MSALIFLINGVVSFFCTLFLLRFMMQAMRVSFAGQLGHFVVTLTNWAVKPLRRFIPGTGGFDWASLFAALAMQLVLTTLIVTVAGVGNLFVLAGWMAIRNLLQLAIYIVIVALILQAVLSWINPYSPLAAPIDQLTRPLLDPIRRILPAISGIDLSPLVAILLLQAALMLL